MPIELSIKASTGVEGYFVHHCERNFLYGALKSGDRKILGLNMPDVRGGNVAATAGGEWEIKVLEELIPEGHRFFKRTEKGYGKFDVNETKELIVSLSKSTATDHEPRYIYQGQLEETSEFRKEFFLFDKSFYDGTDPDLQTHLARTYPDFIRVAWDDDSEKVIVSIVDCKLAAEMKLQHKAQISLYSALLRCMMEEWQEAGLLEKTDADRKNGYLWNRGEEHENPFPLSSTKPLLDEFFTDRLPVIVGNLSRLLKEERDHNTSEGASLLDDTDVCVSQTCEWCENFRQCRDNLQKKGSISLLPYLSGYAQDHVKKISAPNTIDKLLEYIEDENNKSRLTGNRSWDLLLQDGTLLEVHKNAYPYSKDKLYGDNDRCTYSWKKGARSYVLPKGQTVSLFLTAQKDVGTGKVCILGWQKTEYIYTGETEDEQPEIPAETEMGSKSKWKIIKSGDVCISKDSSDEEYVKNAGKFISGLLSDLEDAVGKQFQAYVADSYEKKNLEDFLYDIIERENAADDIREGAMRILLWLQGDRIVTDSDTQPQNAVDTPVIVLIGVIRRLMSLPLPISYNLREIRNVLGAYVPKESLFSKDDVPFFEELSDAVRSEAINDYWNEKNGITEELIKEHMNKRFEYAGAVLQKVQSEGRRNGVLFANADTFSLSEACGLDPLILSKWFYEVRNEELLTYHSIRSERMEDIDQAFDEGSIIKAELVYTYEKRNDGYLNTYYRFKVDSMGDFRAMRWFSALMIEENGLMDLYRFDDYRRSQYNCYVPNNLNIAVLNYPSWKFENGCYYVDIQYNNRSSLQGSIGETYLLCQRYSDINSGKTAYTLWQLNRLAERGLDLLDVSKLCRPTGKSYEDDKAELSGYSKIGGTDFTRSQEAAFKHLYENTLTVLQGPPGTGKTDFIARAVISLCRYIKKNEDSNFRVFVTANSHAAIENALFGIAGKLNGADDIELIKADRFDDDDSPVKNGVTVYKSEEIGCGFEEGNGLDRPAVVGGTNWSAHKMFYNEEEDKESLFDLIIIDEASQVRVMDALIGLSMASNDARILLVGDDDQLPPIIQGEYKKTPGVPYDYGSVFRYYSDRAGDAGFNLMLGEDFRMNEILLRYSAEKIYGDGYKAFNDAIGTRHLEYRKPRDKYPDWVKYALDGFDYKKDEYWPLVFFRISGGTGDEQAELECRLVTEITAALRNSIGSDVDDEAFWNENDHENSSGLFGIISPHHKHIEKLKDSIHEATGMDRDTLFIGTVDKLQGQERDAVIVSYGVTDIEQAVVESEFLFSRNRLNVSLTRGKCKTLVFFSEVLTKCPMDVYASDDEDLQKGAEFVCGLYDFMKKSEPDTEISSQCFGFTVNGEMLIAEICRKRCI